ncbi:MAG: cysteine desulfurase [Clostridia bacterium]|nr:MAG: cysteine desulfurase [Clostridia bacterium]
MPDIYLDNSATTPVLPEVAEAVDRVLREFPGNPSSLHAKGLEAERLLRRAREETARLVGVKPEEVIFTSGGTEANNLAIRGIAHRRRRQGRHLITTAIEHASVLNTFRELEEDGFRVTYLKVSTGGLVEPGEVIRAVGDDTTLVSVMHVNNETGSLQPIAEIGRLLAPYQPQVAFHVDAVQSAGKLDLFPHRWGVDLLTLSAHKIHGPKGVGALVVREGVRLEPLFAGGDQERGLRPGTENVPGIVGLGEAARLVRGMAPEARVRWPRLQQLFLAELSRGADYVVNGPGPGSEPGVPYILNLSFPGVRGEVLVHMLEEQGIYVSTGSACHSRRPEPSHVLVALGLPRRRWESAIRVSFSFLTTEGEVAMAAALLARTVEEYRRMM